MWWLSTKNIICGNVLLQKTITRFDKYLTQYVWELTSQRSLRAVVLVNVYERKGHAREACFLYLLVTGRMPESLELAAKTSYAGERAEVYGSVRGCRTFEELWRIEPTLPSRYQKVLRSYYAVTHGAERDAQIKRKMRDNFVTWSSELGLSDRSVALGAGIDPSNFCAFVRRQELDRLSIDAVGCAAGVYVAEFRSRGA